MKLPGPDHPITITANPKRIRVTAGGVVIADTTHALTLKEASYPAVQYVPRSDANMALLAAHRADHALPLQGRRELLQRRRRRQDAGKFDLDLRDAVPGDGRNHRPSGVLSGQGEDRGSGVGAGHCRSEASTCLVMLRACGHQASSAAHGLPAVWPRSSDRSRYTLKIVSPRISSTRKITTKT